MQQHQHDYVSRAEVENIHKMYKNEISIHKKALADVIKENDEVSQQPLYRSILWLYHVKWHHNFAHFTVITMLEFKFKLLKLLV